MATWLNLRPGDVFDNRYQIISTLGHGGMGSVYRAWQIDVGREVAIKIIHAEDITDQEDRDRFFRECKLLAQLSHKNIICIYSVAVSQENIPYAVSEFIEGVSLRQILAESRLIAWPRVLRIALQICEAMQFVHEQGMIHRDLKPDNVMLVEKPQPDWVKVLDFGMAKNIAVANDAVQRLTITGCLVGSVHYLSPEQCRGEKASIASDIYALACLIFECITGQKLFEADTALGVLHKHIHEDHNLRLEQMKESAPKELADILAKCLAKNADDRLASMKEFADALLPILDEQHFGFESRSAANTIKGKWTWTVVALTAAALILIVSCMARILPSLPFAKQRAAVSSTEAARIIPKSADLTLKVMQQYFQSGKYSELEELGAEWLKKYPYKAHPEKEAVQSLRIIELLEQVYRSQGNLRAAYINQVRLVEILTKNRADSNGLASLTEQVTALVNLGHIESEIDKKRKELLSKITTLKPSGQALERQFSALQAFDEPRVGSGKERFQDALNLLDESSQKDYKVSLLKAKVLEDLADLDSPSLVTSPTPTPIALGPAAHRHLLTALQIVDSLSNSSDGEVLQARVPIILRLANLEDADSAHKRLLALMEELSKYEIKATSKREAGFLDNLGTQESIRLSPASNLNSEFTSTFSANTIGNALWRRAHKLAPLPWTIAEKVRVLHEIIHLELDHLKSKELAHSHLIEALKLLNEAGKRSLFVREAFHDSQIQQDLIRKYCLQELESCNDGNLEWKKGNYYKAGQLFASRCKELRMLNGKDCQEQLPWLEMWGQALLKQNKPDEARELFEQVVSLSLKYKRMDAIYSDAITFLADQYWQKKDYSKVEGYMNDLLKAKLPESRLPGILWYLGLCCQGKGRQSEQLRYFEKSVAAARKLSNHDVSNCEFERQLADLYVGQSRYKEAKPLFEESIRQARLCGPGGRLSLAQGLLGLGHMQVLLREYSSACQNFCEAEATVEALPPSSPGRLELLKSLLQLWSNTCKLMHHESEANDLQIRLQALQKKK